MTKCNETRKPMRRKPIPVGLGRFLRGATDWMDMYHPNISPVVPQANAIVAFLDWLVRRQKQRIYFDVNGVDDVRGRLGRLNQFLEGYLKEHPLRERSEWNEAFFQALMAYLEDAKFKETLVGVTAKEIYPAQNALVQSLHHALQE